MRRVFTSLTKISPSFRPSSLKKLNFKPINFFASTEQAKASEEKQELSTQEADLTDSKAISEQASTEIASDHDDPIPIWEKPYDPAKYEKPLKKIKYTTGLARLDVEPFPRARIMKLCYEILERQKEIPEESMERTYQDEKIRAIMKVTDETEDIQTLEAYLMVSCIELAIQKLIDEMRNVEEIIGNELSFKSKKIDFGLIMKPLKLVKKSSFIWLQSLTLTTMTQRIFRKRGEEIII